MSDDILKRAEAALEGVSAEPWEAMDYDSYPGDEGCCILARASSFHQHAIAYTGLGYPWLTEDQAVADARFIAAELEAARAEVERLRAELDAPDAHGMCLHGWFDPVAAGCRGCAEEPAHD